MDAVAVADERTWWTPDLGSIAGVGWPDDGRLGSAAAVVELRRLHRIKGQVRGLERTVPEERSCVEILTQIAAVRIALDGLALRLVEDHVEELLAAPMIACDPDGAQRRRWMLDTVGRYFRWRQRAGACSSTTASRRRGGSTSTSPGVALGRVIRYAHRGERAAASRGVATREDSR